MPPTQQLQAVLGEKLRESLTGPLSSGTTRRIHGPVVLAGKATAVIGMRRAGKTTFLHQVRRERLQQGTAREHLPYLNFEDERLAELRGPALGGVVEEYYR